MNNTDSPEILAVEPLPSPVERMRRELLLVRLMLIATDLVVSGEGIGLQSARDLLLEILHCYPELAAEWDEI